MVDVSDLEARRAPSPPRGAERVGVRWGVPERSPAARLTLPSLRDGPLPLPPEGRRGVFWEITDAVRTFWQRAGAPAGSRGAGYRQQPGLPRLDREQCRGR